MAEETGQERTEQPTGKRRQEAREEGKIPRSQELSSATVLIAGAVLLAGAAGRTLTTCAARTLRESARSLSAGPWEGASGIAMIQDTVMRLWLSLFPFMLGMLAVVLAINLFQARGVISLKPLRPKWERLSPLANLKRIVGLDGVLNLLKSLVKLVALGGVTWAVLSQHWSELALLAGAGIDAIAVVLGSLMLRVALITGLAFLAVAAIDYLVAVVRHEKSLRMTRQEVVMEHKESEGDPMVKARMRSLARAHARRRMLQQVPRADVVVVNPVHVAVALRYDTQVAAAPVVVAMGERLLAERIKEIAAKASVPIVENVAVARALLATGVIGKPIPPALYAAVAEILAFVYRRRSAARVA